MARSRNIKPGFCENEVLGQLPIETRLLFIALPMFADREGRLEDRPLRLRAQVFPYDTFDLEPMLQSLHDAGFIVRYQQEDNQYIQIVNFSKHQSPHVKEVASTIPAPDKHQTSTIPAEKGELPAPPDSLIPDSLNRIPDSPSKQNGAATPALTKPEWLDTQVWNDYRSFRTSKKAKLTPTAWNRIQAELDRGREKGHDPNDMLGEAMEAGWTGFKVDWYENRVAGNRRTNGTSDDAAAAAIAYRRSQQQ